MLIKNCISRRFNSGNSIFYEFSRGFIFSCSKKNRISRRFNSGNSIFYEFSRGFIFACSKKNCNSRRFNSSNSIFYEFSRGFIFYTFTVRYKTTDLFFCSHCENNTITMFSFDSHWKLKEIILIFGDICLRCYRFIILCDFNWSLNL